MKQKFTASVWPEDDMYVAQCMQINVASQGKTEKEALTNLKEALELYFEEPTATIPQKTHCIEVNVKRAA